MKSLLRSCQLKLKLARHRIHQIGPNARVLAKDQLYGREASNPRMSIPRGTRRHHRRLEILKTEDGLFLRHLHQNELQTAPCRSASDMGLLEEIFHGKLQMFAVVARQCP